MPGIRRILIALDFSETAQSAALRAEELARAVGAELLVLHVLDEPAFVLAEGSGYVSPAIAAEYEAAMRGRLAGAAEALAKHGVQVSTVLARGTTHDAIVSTAANEHVDLIVMGTHGRTGMGRLLLGSVTERVVRLSTVPVMTVRAA